MPESAAAAPRVVLLARAGKAADSLADALRQAGATLLIAADPADTDEPALRALAPEAVLVALEPSIEPALDRLDGLLSDPGLTVIFDEADLAAHRAGWDAARWVRHLSAKLRRDSNVLPPGGEIEQDDLQPSPGSVPTPAAAYRDYDFGALEREAEALAGQVPVDGLPAETPAPAAQAAPPSPPAEAPAPAPVAPPPTEPVAPPLPPLPPIAPVFDPPAAPVSPPPAPPVAPPPLPPVEVPAPAPMAPPPLPVPPAAPPIAIPPPPSPSEAPPTVTGFDLSGFDLSGFDLSGLELADFDAPTAPPPAREPSAVERPFAALGDFELEPLSLESAAPASAAPADGNDIEEAMTLESIDLDTVEIEAPAAEARPLPSFDIGAFDASAFEGMEIEEVSLDGTAVAPEPDAAPSIAPMRFDDDAFFLEELSAKPAAGGDAPSQSVIGALPDTFDATPESTSPGFASFDVAPPASAPSPAARAPGPTDVLSFEELFASSIEAAKQIPESGSRTVDAAPERSETAAPPAAPTFSFEGLSLAADDAPAAPIEAPRDTPRTGADLSALEARISGLSLVDMDGEQGAAAGFGAEAAGHGAVVIEAGLGGPDPTRQILAALPAEFPAVVLVRLHLQGGRYDRLVAQMERAAALPVALAEAGALATPGTIYFLPDGIDVHPGADGLAFIADPAPGAQLFATLAPGRTALVFLSGGDVRLIDAAMAASAAGALLVAQAPEDCYDGEACAELRRRGAVSGLPADLAVRLAARWPSRAQS